MPTQLDSQLLALADGGLHHRGPALAASKRMIHLRTSPVSRRVDTLEGNLKTSLKKQAKQRMKNEKDKHRFRLIQARPVAPDL